jgi:hypothetical protein
MIRDLKYGHATAIHLLHLTHKPADVAEMIAVTPTTIYNW